MGLLSKRLTKIGRLTFWVKFSLIAILILIAIHGLAYGTGFVAGPEAGLEEFGYDTPEPSTMEPGYSSA